jgi:hypothetical protein
MCLQYVIVIFWQKDFGAKAAHKNACEIATWSLFPSALARQFLFLL